MTEYYGFNLLKGTAVKSSLTIIQEIKMGLGLIHFLLDFLKLWVMVLGLLYKVITFP